MIRKKTFIAVVATLASACALFVINAMSPVTSGYLYKPSRAKVPSTQMVYPGNSILFTEDFRGQVQNAHRHKRPQEEGEDFPNAGDFLNMVVTSRSGEIYVIVNFPTGKHAEDEIDPLLRGEHEFPECLRLIRETAFVD